MKYTPRIIGPAALVVLGSVVALLVAPGATGLAKAPPELEKAPVIASQNPVQVGSTLSGSPGVWKSTKDISYTYQWLRCNENGGGCKEISGATKTTYTVVQEDVGHTIRFEVTAKNKDGKTTANSNPTAIVQQGGGGSGGGGGGSSSVVDVKDVGPAGERLVVEQVTFNPNPVTSRNVPIRVKITVKDTKGKLVKGALVFLRSTPVVASIPTDAPTGSDGTVSYSIQPEGDFPIKNSYSVQFFVKAYRSGDPSLAGISGTRLVQVATHKP
jgi:Ig domain of plant-specific actin-binding protein